MVLEANQCEVMNSCYPKYCLVCETEFLNHRDTVIAWWVTAQQVWHKLSCLAVVITEGTLVRYHPYCMILILSDEEFRAGCAVYRIRLVGEKPSLLVCLRIDKGYTHAFGERPYHSIIVYIQFLYLCKRLRRTLYIDDFWFEGSWIIADNTKIGGKKKLVSRIL